MKLRSKAFAAIMCTAAILFPSSSFSEDGDGTIFSALAGEGIVLVLQKYTSNPAVYNRLRRYKGHSYLVSVKSGLSYAVTAACDNKYCSGVDIKVIDNYGDAVKKATRLFKTQKTLEFIAPSSGKYRVEVYIKDCARSTCQYGAQFFYK